MYGESAGCLEHLKAAVSEAKGVRQVTSPGSLPLEMLEFSPLNWGEQRLSWHFRALVAQWRLERRKGWKEGGPGRGPVPGLLHTEKILSFCSAARPRGQEHGLSYHGGRGGRVSAPRVLPCSVSVLLLRRPRRAASAAAQGRAGRQGPGGGVSPRPSPSKVNLIKPHRC